MKRSWNVARAATWLGWQVEANWADPVLFLAYSFAKPLATTLILFFMVLRIAAATTTTGHGSRRQFFFVANELRFWSPSIDH